MKYLNIKKALAAWQNLQPLSEKDRDRLSRRFTVDFNYKSNHIEGNTLTYGQTEILLLCYLLVQTKCVISYLFDIHLSYIYYFV